MTTGRTSGLQARAARGLRLLAVSLAALALAGCGGGSGTSGSDLTGPITIAPTTASVLVGTGSQQFTAKVASGAGASVNWQVNGIAGGNGTVGTISTGGLYAAPASVPTGGTVTVAAVSQSDAADSASAVVTITLPVAVSLAPLTPTVQAGLGSQQFTDTVQNTANTAVSWQVNGVTGGSSTVGTISATGLYVAPANVPAGGSVTVTALSSADPTKSASTTVTVTAPVAVSVAPTTASLQAGLGSQQFTATVQNTANTAVTWQVDGVTNGNALLGTISAAGHYVAPATQPTGGTVTVTAVSAADPTRSAAVTVTITPPVTVSIAPTSSTVQAGLGGQQFTATVQNAGNTAVTWQVNGIAGGSVTLGTISAAGLYHAPTSVPAGGTVTVSAVSVADPTRSAGATVTVTSPVTVTVAPAAPSVQAGSGTQQFTATVQNTANTAVTWQVNSIAGGNTTVGTITAGGLYHAPASVPTGGSVTITAVSSADPTRSGSATATITAGISVSVAPSTPAVQAGIGSQQFTATVQNTGNTAVTWQVNGIAGGNATVGTISASGLYTAPGSVPAGGTVTVTAVSVADPTRSGSATATITAPVAVSVAPTAPSVQAGIGSQQFTATVQNTSNTAVTWQVNSVAGGSATVGTISSAGLYTAPASVPAGGTVTVSAVSSADPTRSGSATATITAPVVVSIAPSAPSVQAGIGSQQFTATVQNTANTAVSWQVNAVAGGNASVGTITAGGLYQAPTSVPAGGTVTITAVSAADPTRSGSATATISAPVAVSVTPATTSVQAGIGTQQFTASVQNTANTAVTWQVNGVAGGNSTVGTISAAGLYAAPASVPAAGSVTVTAVSAADPSRSGSASVTFSGAVSVTVAPLTASVQAGIGSQQFTATVQNTANTAVTWQVNSIAGGNPTVGTITAGGLYSAPTSVPAGGTVTVTAVSVADPTRSGSATATITAPVTVSVAPLTPSVQAGIGSQQFTATVQNTANTAVTWQVNSIAGGNTTVGTITAGGLYHAPASVPAGGTVTITAVSAADPTRSASTIATITAPVTVSVAPSAPSVQAGIGSQQFTATVQNTANTAVTWQVNSIAGGNTTVGTISAGGLYSAPSSVPAGGTVTITAASAADPTRSGTATATITAPVAVSVAPSAPSVQAGIGSQQFTATVQNTANNAVTWQVNSVAGGNATVGTITAAGLYHAPSSVPAGGTVTVTAVSSADPTRSGSATATITAPVTVTVSPSAPSVQAGIGTQQFTATVQNTGNTAVTWQVNAIAGGNATVGTITAGGLYQAPTSVPAGGSVTVTAVSAADPTRSGSATATITAPVAVSIAPTAPTVQAGIGSQQFTATVQNTANTAVTWQVNSIAGGNSTVGTISAAGLYAAPASVPAGGSVTVTAVSAADPTRSGSATATITAPVSVSVSPSAPSVQAGIGSQQFTATVQNSGNTAVTWQVNSIAGGNATVGTITAGGLYAAPASVPSGGTVTVTAVSAADPTRSGSATATIAAPVTVTLSPSAPSVQAGIGSQQFTATVQNTGNTAVTWQVNSIAGGNAIVGTISGTGLYTAPTSVPSGGTVTIAAVSAADPTRSGTATATITAPVSVSVSPSAPSVQAGIGSQQFTATVQNSGNTAVTWQVNSIAGGNSTVGTISVAGLYIAPTSVPAGGTVTITAVSSADPTRSGTATVTITGPVSVSVAPLTPAVQAGIGTQQFTATVQNTANTAVTWQVNSIAGGNATVGTITAGGLYAAPTSVPAGGSVMVTAVSVADPTRSGSATATITAPVSVSVSPSTPSVQAGVGTQQFTATVQNSANTTVTWQVNGVAGGNSTVGTITSLGLYAAPASVPAGGSVTITAVSNADPTRSGTATATITSPVSVSVAPTTASVQAGLGSQQFTATVQNTGNTTVTWQVNGVAGGNATVGTITAGGLYAAPASVPAGGSVTITAVSAADPTRSGTATATITAPVSVSVAPLAPSVQAGLGSQQFTATVQNTGNTAVTWQVNTVAGGNATVGTITAGGLYTAPSSVPTGGTVTITAVSSADPTRSGSATATITAPVAVSVAPLAPTVQVGGGSQQFTATVQNTGNTAVTWQVNGVAGGNGTVGTISAGGLYTAPATVPSGGTVTVTAVSSADPTRSGSATVTLTSTPGTTVTVSPQSAALTLTQTQQFTATVTGGGSVNWTVDGIAGGNATVGTVDSSGFYVPPSTAGTHTVRATNAANSTYFMDVPVAVTDLAGVLTYHNDLARTGQNLQEYALTPATVSGGKFGKRWACAVDGEIYAQPLYVANLSIGGGAHNVVFVATMHNSVYAFNADDPGCGTFWVQSFGNSVPASVIGCVDINTEVGITGTPVIDTGAGTIYFVTKSRESGTIYQRLHALNLVTGAEQANSPATIPGTLPAAVLSNGGTTTFSLQNANQRPGLLLTNGSIYIGWAAHCDSPSNGYHGWVARYDASTLTLLKMFNSTPSGTSEEGGIWMSGGAPAVDSTGSIFLTTGNGDFTDTSDIVPPAAPNNNFGESFVKLDPTQLTVQDYYTPSQWSAWSSVDRDISSSGVVVLPDGKGTAGSPNLVGGSDKQGHFWLLDRTNMQKFNIASDPVVQYVNLPNTNSCWPNHCVMATPGYYNGTIYVATGAGPVMAFPVSNGLLNATGGSPGNATAASQSHETYPYPSPTPVISASPSGNGIIWVLNNNANGTTNAGVGTVASGPAILRAYDATNLATTLYSSAAASGDAAGNAVKFTLPLVANGHVYVGGQKQLTVYGLAP